YELGLTQKEIEDFIIENHKPYLKNKSIPRIQVYTYMSQYIDSLIQILSNENNKILFENCLDIYWKAKEKDPIRCYKSYEYWEDDILEATSKLVTMINIDRDRNQMNLYEFAEDVFTKIGKIIEKLIQPYLRIILYLEKVINNENPNIFDLNKYSIGTIIDELLKFKIFNNLLTPGTWNIKLNQWRNIPKHDKYSVKDNKIICKYGIPPNEKIIKLFQPELWMLFENINEIFSLLRLAHSLFFLDNMEEIMPYWKNKQLRQESSLLDLISLYDILGFSVKDYILEDNTIKFVVRDLTKKDCENRLKELLMLLRPIWYKIKKRFIRLKYLDSNSNPIYSIEADISKRKDIFSEGVDEKLLTLENLKDCIELTDLRINKSI
ncbi:MAG: hypothetical protein ACFFG0_16370, partial [Candidatus Thorarchaeota archaeon]